MSTPTILCLIAHLALCVVAWRSEGTLAGPWTGWLAAWSGAQLLLLATGGVFYRLSPDTNALLLLGSLVFGFGTVVGRALVPTDRPAPAVAVPQHQMVLTALLLLLVLLLPAFVARVLTIAGSGDLLTALYRVRAATVTGTSDVGFGIFGSVIQLALLVAFLALALPRAPGGTLWRVGGAVALAVVYVALTGSRNGIATLFAGAAGILFLRDARPSVAQAIGLALGFLALFGGMAVLLGKGTASVDASALDNLVAVGEGIAWYVAGPLVALDAVVADPFVVPETGGALRTAFEILNRFGAQIDVPTLHAQYVTVGDFKDMNTFTLYFAYLPQWGWAGAAIALGIAGVACGGTFAVARQGGVEVRVLYAVCFASVLQSIFNEAFFTNINMLAKTLLFVAALAAFRRLTTAAVREAHA